MSKPVIVTGAFGRVGQRVLHHLLQANHKVIAIDLETPKNRKVANRWLNSQGGAKSIEVCWGNICDASLWEPLLERASGVIHMAAIIPPATEHNPKLAVAVNQTATENLVKQMEQCQGAKRLIFASSMAVAGHSQHLRQPPLSAYDDPAPVELYGRTKEAAEASVKSSSLDWSILRIASVAPAKLGLAEVKIMGSMFDASPNGRVEVIHEDDAGLAFANAVNADGAIGKILYVGGGPSCQVTALDFYNAFLDCAGIGPLPVDCLRPGDQPYFFGDWLDTVESQALLNFQRHTIDDIFASNRRQLRFIRLPLRIFSPLLTAALANTSPHKKAAV